MSNNYRFFKTFSVSLNDKEKETLYNDYVLRVNSSYGGLESPLSYDDFFSQDGFYERINMRWLHCRYRQTLNFSIYKCQVKNGQKCAVKIPHFDLIQVYL